MTKKEKLIDDYEDALFALLMEDVAQIEGTDAIQLNVKLLEDSRYAIPEAVQKRCKKTIYHAFSRKNRKRIEKKAVKIIQYISVAMMIAVLLFTTAFAGSPNIRRMTLNVMIDLGAKYSEFRSEDNSLSISNMSPIDDLEYYYNIAFEWLPKGYTVANGSKNEGGSDIFLHNNETDGWIEVYISGYDGLSHQIDSEDAEIKYITIQDCPGILVTKEVNYLPETESYTRRRIVWPDNEQQVLIDVITSNLTEDEIIHLAGGIRWDKSK